MVVARERLAVYADLPAVQSLETKDRAQQCGLSRPVGANQAGELTPMNSEAHVVENCAPAKGDADVINIEDRKARRS